VDFASAWFHRQSAQGAADAACTAAIMDMLVNNTNGTSLGHFTVGIPFTCTGIVVGVPMSGSTPCQYAALNGYNGTGLTSGASNNVSVSFPSSVPGVTPASGFSNPFIQVNITDRVPLSFAPMITGSNTLDVGASATCAVVAPKVAAPILILDPSRPGTFTMGGNACTKVVGGGPRGIQVNSGNSAAVVNNGGCPPSPPTCLSGSGGPSLDLSRGGQNLPGTGSDMGIFGGPSTPSQACNYIFGTTGQYVSPSTPVPDVFAALPAPSVPPYPAINPSGQCTAATAAYNPCRVSYQVNGCPDPSGCWEFSPGLYDGTHTTIVSGKSVVQNPVPVGLDPSGKGPIIPPGQVTVLFDPGLYYINASTKNSFGLNIQNITVRPSNVTNPDPQYGPGGTMFYLSGPSGACCGSVNITSACTTCSEDAFYSAGGGPDNNVSITCPGATTPNPPPPVTLQGSVLLGVCGGTYNPSNFSAQTFTRGMLFFGNRADNPGGWKLGETACPYPNACPTLSGNGGLLTDGYMYFHQCPEANPPASVVTSCKTSEYQEVLSLTGSTNGTAYLLSGIVTDQLLVSGSGQLTLQLIPFPAIAGPKVALVH
jgi:hypothetical protein